MGIFDKAKDAINQNADKVRQGVDRISDPADHPANQEHPEPVEEQKPSQPADQDVASDRPGTA